MEAEWRNSVHTHSVHRNGGWRQCSGETETHSIAENKAFFF